MLDVHRLRLLRELDRLGTLAAVARALSYSPSAVSQQLSQLEAEAGVALLEPAGRGVRLTAQARILVAHAEMILEHLEQAEADLRASLTEVGGTLRVASFQSVLLALVPEVLTALAARHPGLRVEITHQEADDAFAGLLARDFDVVLGEEYPGAARPPVPGASTRLLARDELFLVLPAHGPYARAADESVPATLPDLADVPWILDAADSVPGQWARDTCRAAGFEPDVRYTGSDLLLQVHLAELGHAAAMIPGLLLAAVPPPAARVRALPGHPRRRLTTGIRSGAAADPAIRAFRTALSEAIQSTGHRAGCRSLLFGNVREKGGRLWPFALTVGPICGFTASCAVGWLSGRRRRGVWTDAGSRRRPGRRRATCPICPRWARSSPGTGWCRCWAGAA